MASTSIAMRDLLTPKAVTAQLDAATKKDILTAAAELIAPQTGLDAHVIFNALWEREKLGSTGMGAGIAVPHARVPGLAEVRGFFARLTAPVEFESLDGKPIDLVFVLLSPEEASADHLQALATVSRVLRDALLCEQVRRAKNDADVYKLFMAAGSAAAA